MKLLFLLSAFCLALELPILFLLSGLPQAGPAFILLPQSDLYALDADNTLWLMRNRTARFNREIPVRGLGGGNLIGIDFRASDGQLYGLTDTGNVYTIDITRNRGLAIPVGTLNSRFAGGYQSLMDFNPVVDAIRLIGSNDQNYAILLNIGAVTTALQTKIAYAAGDVNAGADPNISGGAYTNNLAGATTTVFYAIDYDLDTLVTAPLAANGSSATGAGQLQTIGRLQAPAGNFVNLTPTADLDIITDLNGNNYLIGLNGRSLFAINLNQINPALPLGTTQPVTVRSVSLPDGGFIDVAATLDRYR